MNCHFARFLQGHPEVLKLGDFLLVDNHLLDLLDERRRGRPGHQPLARLSNDALLGFELLYVALLASLNDLFLALLVSQRPSVAADAVKETVLVSP